MKKRRITVFIYQCENNNLYTFYGKSFYDKYGQRQRPSYMIGKQLTLKGTLVL